MPEDVQLALPIHETLYHKSPNTDFSRGTMMWTLPEEDNPKSNCDEFYLGA
jgi:hypothetical protein